MARRAKMAALAEQLDDKLDQKIDQAAAATSKLQAAAKARVQTAQGPPVAAAKAPAAAPPTPPARAALEFFFSQTDTSLETIAACVLEASASIGNSVDIIFMLLLHI